MRIRHQTYRLALITLAAMALRPESIEAQIAAPVVLRVYGMGTLPPGIADRARQVVGEIYSAAGTRIEWRSGSDTAETPGGFQVSLLFRRRSDADTPLLVLGFAPATRGRLVYVLYDHVEAFAVANHLEIGHALGHVMAHEVGHVLLPSHAHSRTGLMSGNLNFQSLRRKRQGALLFTSRQAAQIRARLTADEGAIALNTEH
jgi:hypothetical protein